MGIESTEDFPTMAARLNAQTVIELQQENGRLRSALARIAADRAKGGYALALARIQLAAREVLDGKISDIECRELFDHLQSAEVCAATREKELL